MIESDTYKTISKSSSEVLFKDKNSKFFGYVFPVSTEENVKKHLEVLKKQHHSASHWCYAYQIGKQEKEHVFRANDDGEPNNSAGMPIYGQIKSFGVTNVLIIVVRYFGGTKLGVSGLINAYKTASQMALEESKIIIKTINVTYQITFEYKNMNKVMRIIKEKNLKILNQTLEVNCQMEFSVRKKNADVIFGILNALQEIDIKVLND
ncbi:MAG: YigZ family protein [Aquaticitalea sp.]